MKPYKIVPALGFDFLTSFYDFFTNLFGFGNTLQARFIKAIKLEGYETILDIGSGTGSLVIALKESYPDIEVFGVDPDPKILKISQRKAQKGNVDVKFRNSKAEKLPFENNYFDIIISTLTFHHIPREAKIAAAKEIKRVLKPAGKFFILDFLNVGKSLVWKIVKIFEEGKSLGSNNELESIFEKSGFKVSKFKNSLPWSLEILSGKIK